MTCHNSKPIRASMRGQEDYQNVLGRVHGLAGAAKSCSERSWGGIATTLTVEANPQLSVWLEPRPQDLPGLRCFAGKDAFGAEQTEGDNVEFADAIPRTREGPFRARSVRRSGLRKSRGRQCNR